MDFVFLGIFLADVHSGEKPELAQHVLGTGDPPSSRENWPGQISTTTQGGICIFEWSLGSKNARDDYFPLNLFDHLLF